LKRGIYSPCNRSLSRVTYHRCQELHIIELNIIVAGSPAATGAYSQRENMMDQGISAIEAALDHLAQIPDWDGQISCSRLVLMIPLFLARIPHN
jgi:hypothetical protein